MEKRYNNSGGCKILDKKKRIKELVVKAKEELNISETEFIALIKKLSSNGDFKRNTEVYDEVSPGIYRKVELIRKK